MFGPCGPCKSGMMLDCKHRSTREEHVFSDEHGKRRVRGDTELINPREVSPPPQKKQTKQAQVTRVPEGSFHAPDGSRCVFSMMGFDLGLLQLVSRTCAMMQAAAAGRRCGSDVGPRPAEQVGPAGL